MSKSRVIRRTTTIEEYLTGEEPRSRPACPPCSTVEEAVPPTERVGPTCPREPRPDLSDLVGREFDVDDDADGDDAA
jgi:hypothetical protein